VRYLTAGISFAIVFLIVFVLAGWFVLPHVPPTPAEPVSAFELSYWIDNWPGYLGGLVLGALSARATLKKTPSRSSET
jgi:hypothetical protein